MSSVRFETPYPPPTQPGVSAKLADVRLAAALLAGAASMAEAEIAGGAMPAPAAAGRLQAIIKSCNDFERALATPAYPAVSTATLPDGQTLATISAVSRAAAAVSSARLPSPATREAIAVVEAARASMPSPATLKSIAAVEATMRPNWKG
jgi:hypothetical protein